jgi:hypothetical protein
MILTATKTLTSNPLFVDKELDFYIMGLVSLSYYHASRNGVNSCRLIHISPLFRGKKVKPEFIPQMKDGAN